MRKNALLAVLLSLVCVKMAISSARTESNVALSGQDDGNVRVGASASCTSSAWTAVVATRAARRLVLLKASDSNTGNICLGTDDAGGVCSTAQLGYELGTGDGYEDASEAPLYCRSDEGTQIVKGFDLYDNRDSSAD